MALENVNKLITYNEPLDIAKLFIAENVSETLSHIARVFIDRVEESRQFIKPYTYELIGSHEHETMYIDYLFLLKCLSDLCVNGDMVLNDFNVKGEATEGGKSAKNALYLISGLLELGIGVGYVNTRKSIRYGVRSFVPMVLERDEKYKMMAAVVLLRKRYRELMKNDDLWHELMEYLLDGETNIVPNTFGATPAYAFFKKLDMPVSYLNSL
jgi:hypothetical protein